MLAEEFLEGLAEGLDVGHFAVAHDAGLEGSRGGALDGDRAVDADLGGSEVPGLDVEPDHATSCP